MHCELLLKGLSLRYILKYFYHAASWGGGVRHPPLLLGLHLFNFTSEMNESLIKDTFLGGLSLHLNHLIASCSANYDWPFGTLPFELFGSNLDTRDLETYPRTCSGHF